MFSPGSLARRLARRGRTSRPARLGWFTFGRGREEMIVHDGGATDCSIWRPVWVLNVSTIPGVVPGGTTTSPWPQRHQVSDRCAKGPRKSRCGYVELSLRRRRGQNIPSSYVIAARTRRGRSTRLSGVRSAGGPGTPDASVSPALEQTTSADPEPTKPKPSAAPSPVKQLIPV